tara:strand:- start:19259 stop:19732 length:474 start_codon:yes stop_codon:yes gene_type:complete
MNNRCPFSLRFVLPGLLALIAGQAIAQKLPPPAKTVFKCEVGGRIIYTDSPCPGAEKIEVEPTRGVDGISGKKRVGRDVQREQHRELMADALKPLTGLNAKQLEVRQRRQQLDFEAQQECMRLDRQIPALELEERTAKASAQAELFALRKRFRGLGC